MGAAFQLRLADDSDYAGLTTGPLSAAGVTTTTLTASGALSAASASITNGLSAATGTFSGALSAAGLTISGSAGAGTFTASTLGSASAPALALSNSTGMWSPGTAQLSFAAGGAACFTINQNDSANGVSATLVGTFYDALSPLLRFGTANVGLMGYQDYLWVRTGDGTTAAGFKAKTIYLTGADATTGDSVSGFGGNIGAGGACAFRFYNSSRITDVADGIIQLFNNAKTSFSKLYLGPYTASFPMLKVNGPQLQIKLGDETAFAPIQAAAATFTSTAISGNETVGGTLNVTGVTTLGTLNVTTLNATTYNVGSQLAVPVGAVGTPGLAFAANLTSGLYYTTNALNFAANGIQAGFISSIGELALPLTNNTFPNSVSGIRLGPADSTGIKIFRNGSGVIQFGLWDGSANATAFCKKWGTSNLDGTTQFGSGVSSDVSGVRIYYDASAIAANTYAVAMQQRIMTMLKTADYTVAKADTGKRIVFAGASAQPTATLPAATLVGSADSSFYIIVSGNSFGVKVKPAGTDIIQLPGSASTASTGFVSCTGNGQVLRLFVSATGVWSCDGAPSTGFAAT